MYKEKESGRSMVEMLGVLAIIGVLSVGGIAGYTTAMNKHRANKLLQQASLRAVVISSQIQKGIDNPTLAEFTDNTVAGATFTGLAAWNKDTDKRFSLTLTGVDEKICTQMKASIGQNSLIREMDESCTTITYNNDLSSTDPISSGNECTTECQNGATCENGYCECPKGTIWHPTSDTLGNGLCKSGMTGDCTTNADCEAGKYCEIEGSNCNTPTTGTCETLDNGIKLKYKGKTFLYSANEMQWWAARNWCLAHGKSLASLSDLGITRPSDASCKKSECIGADWDALTAAFGSRWYWTNDSKTYCTTFAVLTSSQQWVYAHGRANPYGALCK